MLIMLAVKCAQTLHKNCTLDPTIRGLDLICVAIETFD